MKRQPLQPPSELPDECFQQVQPCTPEIPAPTRLLMNAMEEVRRQQEETLAISAKKS